MFGSACTLAWHSPGSSPRKGVSEQRTAARKPQEREKVRTRRKKGKRTATYTWPGQECVKVRPLRVRNERGVRASDPGAVDPVPPQVEQEHPDGPVVVLVPLADLARRRRRRRRCRHRVVQRAPRVPQAPLVLAVGAHAALEEGGVVLLPAVGVLRKEQNSEFS